MDEYISRHEAIRAVQLSYGNYEATRKAIFELPAADVAPVRHGRWEYIPQTLNTLSQLRCPFCGWWSLDPSIDGAYNYYPNCGAKMDGGDRDAVDGNV